MDDTDFSRLLKKVSWSDPSPMLACRILQEIQPGIQTYRPGTSEWRPSPMLFVMAIVLAVFLGGASGSLTLRAGSATGVATPATDIYHLSAGSSLMGVYAGNGTGNSQ